MESGEILDAAQVGFAGLDVAPSTQAAALEHLSVWLDDPRFAAYRSQILSLSTRSHWRTLLDSFYQHLPFGTGGRRGRVGIGPNRFNPWTFAVSIQGHATWLRSTHGDGSLMVVVGYDVRQFQDLYGALDPDIPSPVSQVRSRDFAEIAAEIYAAHEIRVVLPAADAILSTPELSFAVRALSAHGGLVISASHNHPDDNGSKFYHAHGGQLTPPSDQALEEHIAAVKRVERMSIDRGIANGLVRALEPEVHSRYIETNLAILRRQTQALVPVVFTPLHGTADTTVGAVLTAAGVPLTLEPSQSDHDGSFPTVPFRTPNPEQPGTLDIAIQTATRAGVRLVMGCDPDADRLGVAVEHQGHWVTLNGNEIAALVCHAALTDHPHPEPLVLKTLVTTGLVTRIAEAHGAAVVEDLLVGFKYIGEALYGLERKGRFGRFEGDTSRFAVGVEESHGVLVTPDIRDKDAAGGALLLTALASREAAENRSLIDTLDDLMRAHGVFHNHLASTVLEGATGRARIAAIMAAFRATPPTHIGGRIVDRIVDRQDPNGVAGPAVSETDHISRNMLCFHLEGGARLILRPSGTEPKAKVYVETSAEAEDDIHSQRSALKAEAEAISRDFITQMLARIELSLPAWAHEISELVSIDTKLSWSGTLVPRLLEQIEADPDGAPAWLKTVLDADRRAQLKPGIDALISTLGFEHPSLSACFKGSKNR
jgi:phosphoglucomutase